MKTTDVEAAVTAAISNRVDITKCEVCVGNADFLRLGIFGLVGHTGFELVWRKWIWIVDITVYEIQDSIDWVDDLFVWQIMPSFNLAFEVPD